MMIGDEGSGNGVLMPLSTVSTALVTSTSTTSSVKRNLNTFLSMVISTSDSVEMTEESTSLVSSMSTINFLFLC